MNNNDHYYYYLSSLYFYFRTKQKVQGHLEFSTTMHRNFQNQIPASQVSLEDERADSRIRRVDRWKSRRDLAPETKRAED